MMDTNSLTGEDTPKLSGITPLFIRNSELTNANNGKYVKGYEVYEAVVDTVGNGMTDGIQRQGALWRIYPRTVMAKTELQTRGITVNEKNIRLFSDNPFATNASSPDDKRVKVTIHGYPMSGDNGPILTFCEKHNVVPCSPIKDGMLRTRRGHLTDCKDGSKFFYVEAASVKDNQLPRDAFISRFKCRIVHFGQKESMKNCTNCYGTDHWTRQCPNERVCRVCRKAGHIEGEEDCDFYHPNENVVPFGGYKDELSNHYRCDFMHGNIPVKSTEHAWFHDKAVMNGQTDLADKILEAETAKEAKALGNMIPCVEEWDKEHVNLMETINTEKFEQVEKCQKRLLSTEGMTLAEAVPTERDRFWSTGIDKQATQNTNPSHWPGDNGMGKVLMNVRDKLLVKQINAAKSESTRSRSRGGRGTGQRSPKSGRGTGQISPRSASTKRNVSPNATSSPARKPKVEELKSNASQWNTSVESAGGRFDDADQQDWD